MCFESKWVAWPPPIYPYYVKVSCSNSMSNSPRIKWFSQTLMDSLNQHTFNEMHWIILDTNTHTQDIYMKNPSNLILKNDKQNSRNLIYLNIMVEIRKRNSWLMHGWRNSTLWKLTSLERIKFLVEIFKASQESWFLFLFSFWTFLYKTLSSFGMTKTDSIN